MGISSARIWSVTALCRRLGDLMDQELSPVQVSGEVSGFTQASSGHCYFTLKDAQSQLRCALFRRTAAGLTALPRDGEAVEVLARLAIHSPRGDLQLVVEDLRPAGRGTHFEQFLRLKAHLEAEGLFNPQRKKALPAHPATVAIVTSPDAAALADVLTTLARRAPQVQVLLQPCQVQGAGAARTIVDALEQVYVLWRQSSDASTLASRPDVVLLVRGGGAWEDLQAFNDEEVARCIGRSPIPVVAGVGHETDFTIADFVADIRAPTPTAAAELCAPPLATLLQELDVLERRWGNAVDKRLQSLVQRLDWNAMVLSKPDERVVALHRHIDALESRLQAGVAASLSDAERSLSHYGREMAASGQRQCERQQHRTMQLQTRLSAMDPHTTLRRGYAWLEGPGGIVARAQGLQPGNAVRATLADGVVEMTVTGKRS